MTSFRSRHLNHRCSDKGCYVDALSCWDDIADCFPGAIRPSDIDGSVEINRHVLMLEEKSAGVGLPTGQRRMFKTLAEGPLSTTVVCFRPTQIGATEQEVLWFPEPNGWTRMPRSQLLDHLNRWAGNAMEGRLGI